MFPPYSLSCVHTEERTSGCEMTHCQEGTPAVTGRQQHTDKRIMATTDGSWGGLSLTGRLMEGRRGIITGAASANGIGRAAALLLAAHGARLAILDNDEAGARQGASLPNPAIRVASRRIWGFHPRRSQRRRGARCDRRFPAIEVPRASWRARHATFPPAGAPAEGGYAADSVRSRSTLSVASRRKLWLPIPPCEKAIGEIHAGRRICCELYWP
ncbi:hypothetical protein EV667_4132 [Ancylobacter aquaticus]|uniref:SDR family NAD(P)-dependent oxidoreductase n=1 Tax=Ancylobacter aquaticus TaxID=100 RepID=A0A4R1HQQ8_ANCAQ|nr:hypothetical protein EV667_4132 [Ancylobacter aquaticus]